MDDPIDRLVTGELTVDGVAAEFSRCDWSVPAMSTDAVLAGEEEPSRANCWEAVEVACQLGDITEAQYKALDDARCQVVWH